MENAVVVKGKLVAPTRIELDEPVQSSSAAVAVIVCPISTGTPSANESVFDFLRRLPAGTRTKEEIDRQLSDDREWGAS